MSCSRSLLCTGLFFSLGFAAENPDDPWVDRFEPFGGQVGETVHVSLLGKNLDLPRTVEFDSPHLRWEPLEASSDAEISGRIFIGEKAPLGPHIATLITVRGRSNSRLFYVDGFESTSEIESNDLIHQAQELVLKPQTVQGMMLEVADIDYFAFEARAGERWTFEVRSLEYGGFLENDLTLLDSAGERVAFNDDRDDYLETPFLEHRFAGSGRFYLINTVGPSASTVIATVGICCGSHACLWWMPHCRWVGASERLSKCRFGAGR